MNKVDGYINDVTNRMTIKQIAAYKIKHLNANSSICKWIICSQKIDNRIVYYKLELDNVNFGHSIHGCILLPYELANDLCGILNNGD